MQRCEKQVREDIHYFLPSSPLPFVVEMCGISYCDGTYRQERVNSPICVLEYVAEGTGTVIVEGVAHTASAGDVYLLPMGSSHRYFSDGEHPWTKLFINAWGPVIPPLLTAYGLDGQVVFPSCPLEGLFRDLFALSGGAGPGGLPQETVMERCALKFHEILMGLSACLKGRAAPPDEAARLKNLIDSRLNQTVTIREPAEEILSAFLVQYYTPRGLLPRQILLPEAMEGAADLGRLLSHQAGRKVELVTPQRGAKADLIRMAQENARTECERLTTREERTAKILTLLAQLLELPGPPRRIEAYDISNTGAADIVAAMTVFEQGRPRKGAYRYFALRDLDGPDDYASMEQVITRRFRHEKEGDETFASRPDLLLIDGGETHAAVALQALTRYGLDIPVFGMVKDDRHRTRALVTPDGREIGIQAVPALFAFIGQIQEETHRSAVGFHHRRHTKSGLGSTLERIPGIGEARRKKLLKAFGSVKAIRQADLPALEEVLPKAAARAVYEQFRTKEEETTCASSQARPGAGG